MGKELQMMSPEEFAIMERKHAQRSMAREHQLGLSCGNESAARILLAEANLCDLRGEDREAKVLRKFSEMFMDISHNLHPGDPGTLNGESLIK